MSTLWKDSEHVGLTKGRIEALTDGIFAFAMTLLVTGLDLFGSKQTQIPSAALDVLSRLYPDFVHYVIAFMTLAGFWYSHHSQYSHIRFIDRKLLWVNIVSLMFVALVPFSTSLAGDYPDDPLASAVLEANLLVIGLLFYWQWAYACKGYRLVEEKLSLRTIEQGKKTSFIIPALSVVALVLAFMNVRWSSAVYLLVPVLLALLSSNEAPPT